MKMYLTGPKDRRGLPIPLLGRNRPEVYLIGCDSECIHPCDEFREILGACEGAKEGKSG